MASTELDIWKLALSKIGNTNFPSGPTDQTAEAQVCVVEFPQVRDATLELAPWPFATTRATLSQLTETRTGWYFTYQTPNDYIALQGVTSELGKYLAYEEQELYDVELAADGNSRIIVANVELMEMLYTRRVTNVAVWPALFVDCVVYGLAASLALSIKKDIGTAERMHEIYTLRIGQASASQQRQRRLGSPSNTLLDSRN
jgi:hypothetical protein